MNEKHEKRSGGLQSIYFSLVQTINTPDLDEMRACRARPLMKRVLQTLDYTMYTTQHNNGLLGIVALVVGVVALRLAAPTASLERQQQSDIPRPNVY